MCHLILAMPFIALPMLWLLPLSVGVPLYGVVLALAAAAYVMTLRAMQRPVTAGAEALMHAVGTVSAVDRRTPYVWIVGERWSAISQDDVLAVGDTVEVIAREGLTLHVRRLAAAAIATPASRSARTQPDHRGHLTPVQQKIHHG